MNPISKELKEILEVVVTLIQLFQSAFRPSRIKAMLEKKKQIAIDAKKTRETGRPQGDFFK